MTKRRSQRRTPLQIAIEKNFYSLAELLLEGGADPFANGSALDYCLSKNRPEIAELLLDHGVPLDAVDFSYICEWGNPDIIRLFLKRGADPTKDFAFYHAIINSLKPALGIYKEYKDKFPALQQQLNAALNHFVEEKKVRGVALCVWAGADPSAPAVDPDNPEGNEDDDEVQDCPLVTASWGGQLDVLKALKPEKYPDQLPRLISACHGGIGMIEYLLSIGAPVNEKPNGGSGLMDSLVSHYGWSVEWSGDTRVRETLDKIAFIASKGAKWIPNEDDRIGYTRRNFYKLSGSIIVDFVKTLREHDAATVELIEELLRTPKMREVMGRSRAEVQRILHPPPPKPPAEDDTTGSGSTNTVTPKAPVVPKLPIAELRKNAEAFLIDFICQRPIVRFWASSISDCPPAARTKKRLGMTRDDDRDPIKILQEAAARLQQRLKSVTFNVDPRSYHGIGSVAVCLNEGHNWLEVIEHAWKLTGRPPNDHLLTDVAAQTMAWLSKPENNGQFIKQQSLSHKMGLGGRFSDLEDYLKEIGLKTPKLVRWETKGDRHTKPPLFYKLHLEDQERPVVLPQNALNPAFAHDFGDYGKADLEKCRDLIFTHILDTKPEGESPAYIVWVNTRTALRACFPEKEFDRWSTGGDLAGFFKEVPLISELKRSYDFRKEAPAWFLAIHPAETWEESLQAIEAAMNRPSAQEAYGISPDAGLLLEWVESLQDDQLEYGLSPVIEDHLKRHIGLKPPWGDENFGAYIQLLLDEINDKTSWDLRMQPWKKYSSWNTRLRVRKEQSQELDLIRRVQLFALEHGRAIDQERVKEKIAELLED